MRLKFVTIGPNLRWPRGRLSLARKKNTKGIYDSRFSSSNNTPSSPTKIMTIGDELQHTLLSMQDDHQLRQTCIIFFLTELALSE